MSQAREASQDGVINEVRYPLPSSAAASATMRSNRRRDTGPELALRSALHRRGWRFRVDLPVVASDRRVRPDIAFPRRRVAVFVDGCFWHSCPTHGRQPAANARYWERKLNGNAERDRADTDALEGSGWTVVRVWEHENTADAVLVVEAALT
ncbi:MAG: very short patch repair endonuclease [Chloroflexi bacterium]|nr:very short patch repair endonuclease [Chloroflexota bacterium]